MKIAALSSQIACERTVLWDPQEQTYGMQPAIVHCEGSKITFVEIFPDRTTWQQEVDRRMGEDGLEVLTHHVVSPAFVNAHTHVSMGYFRGILAQTAQKKNLVEDLFFHVESHLEPEDVFAFARMGAYESLLAGVGVVWEHYYHGQEIAAALAEVGVVGVVAPTLQDRKGPGVAQRTIHWRDMETLYAESQRSEATCFVAVGPHAPDSVSESLWREALQAAQSWNIPLHFHLGQSQEEYREIFEQTGLSPVGFLQKLGIWDHAPQTVCAHSIYVSQAELKLLSAGRHALVFCPSAQMVFEFPAAVLAWEKAGVSWVVATDSAAGNDSMSLQKELRFVSGVPRQALSFSSALQTFLSSPTAHSPEVVRNDVACFTEPSWLLHKVWGQPGALHPQFRAGAIEVGALANLIAWDLHHPAIWPGDSLRSLAFCDGIPAISNVMTAGQWRGEWGHFSESLCGSNAYHAARLHAERRFRTLLVRCGF